MTNSSTFKVTLRLTPQTDGDTPKDRQPKLYTWVKDVIEGAGQDFTLDNLADFGAGLLTQAKEAGIDIAAKAITKFIVEAVLALVPTGISQAVAIAGQIYKIVQFVIDYYQRIAKLIETIQMLLEDAVGQKGKDVIVQRTESLLKDSIVPILGGLASAAGVGNVSSVIKRYLQMAKAKAQQPVKSVLRIAAKPVQKTLEEANKILSLGAGDPKPLLKPASFGRGQVWVDQKGEIWVKTSPSEKLPDWLKKNLGDKKPPAGLDTAAQKLTRASKALADATTAAAQQPTKQSGKGLQLRKRWN